jgi:hypothetical protein
MNVFCGGACRYYEKRLPESWEWQFVAQGGTQRRFPWGDDEDCESCAPPQDNTRCITVSFISLVSSLKNGRLPRQARDKRQGTEDKMGVSPCTPAERRRSLLRWMLSLMARHRAVCSTCGATSSSGHLPCETHTMFLAPFSFWKPIII